MSWPQLVQLTSIPCSISWTHSCICGQPATDGLTHLPGAWLAHSQGSGGNWAVISQQTSPCLFTWRYGRVPKSSKRGKPQCACAFQPSAYILFANVSLAKISRTVKPRCRGWRNELHLWLGEDVKSQCKGMWIQGGEGYVAIFAWSPIEWGNYRKKAGTLPWSTQESTETRPHGLRTQFAKHWTGPKIDSGHRCLQKKQSRAGSTQAFFQFLETNDKGFLAVNTCQVSKSDMRLK